MVLTLVALAAACGGDGETGREGGAAGDGGEFDSPEAIAQVLGCSGFEEGDSEELGVDEDGTCRLQEEEIHVYTFARTEARDTYIEIAKQFGGEYVIGDNWAVQYDDNSVGKAVIERLGGERV